MAANQFIRGVAVTGLTFGLINKTNGNAVDSGVATAYITKDGGIQAPATNLPVSKNNGQWSLDLTATERQCKITGILIVHASAVILNINVISNDELGSGSQEVVIDYNTVAAGADFWLTYTTSNTVVASGVLDSNGNATVYLDPGNYYVYIQKIGVNGNNPRTISVV